MKNRRKCIGRNDKWREKLSEMPCNKTQGEKEQMSIMLVLFALVPKFKLT